MFRSYAASVKFADVRPGKRSSASTPRRAAHSLHRPSRPRPPGSRSPARRGAPGKARCAHRPAAGRRHVRRRRKAGRLRSLSTVPMDGARGRQPRSAGVIAPIAAATRREKPVGEAKSYKMAKHFEWSIDGPADCTVPACFSETSIRAHVLLCMPFSSMLFDDEDREAAEAHARPSWHRPKCRTPHKRPRSRPRDGGSADCGTGIEVPSTARRTGA